MWETTILLPTFYEVVKQKPNYGKPFWIIIR